MPQTAQIRDTHRGVDAPDALGIFGSLVIHGDQATLFGPVGSPVPSGEQLNVPRRSADQLSAPPAINRARPPSAVARAAALIGPVAVGGTLTDLSGNWATGRRR
jgi:hypothetical protein